MRLYELTGELLELLDMMEESEIDSETLQTTFDCVQEEYADKIESYIKVVKTLENDTAFLAEEIKRLDARKKVISNNIDRLKKMVFDSLTATGTPKVKTPTFTISIVNNGGKLPLVQTPEYDIRNLGEALIVTSYKPNEDRIRELLEAGEEVPGYTFGERGKHLGVR